MKEGWRMVKLGEVCEVIAGQSPKGSSYNTEGIGIEFHQGKKAFGDTFICPSNVWTTEVTKVAESGDILMSVRAPVGPTNFTDRRICIGRGLAAIRCTSKSLPQFVLYALKNIESKIVGKDGAVFSSINKVMIENLPIPVLTLPEQERIVSILDAEFAKIDAVKAGAEKSLQHAKDLFQAALKKELITKKYRLLKDIYNIKTGKLNSNEAIEGGIYPFFTCSREIFSINHYAFDCEAILLAGNNASGDFNVKHYKGKFNAYQRTYVITAKDIDTNTRILYYVLIGYLENLKKMSLGANTKFLKLGMIENIAIPYLSLPEQEQIVTRLDALSANCKTIQANYERTIALCDDMKQALLRKAFNGEL